MGRKAKFRHGDDTYGSRANPKTHTDIFSDYDIQLFVSDIVPYMSDDWLASFGSIMVKWPHKPMSTLDRDWITRLVLFDNQVRIDFQITAKKSVDPSAYDSGYRVMIDKQGLARGLKEPTFSEYLIRRPTRDEYDALVNGFFWDAVYIAKYLWRDEVYFAKYMFDSLIRFQHLCKVIERYISSRNHWAVETGIYGRFFKRYLDRETWLELETTFSDANIENNWEAFFKMIALFRKLARQVAAELEYVYSEELDRKVTSYCLKARDSAKE